jgi:site-specific DNA-methyltransferase (adenine-specific)
MRGVELDKIYCTDCRAMREVDDNSVQLIVTSPPYNVGKEYAQHRDAMEIREYLAFLNQVWQECQRVLCRGGRLAVNIANTGRKPYVPLSAYIAEQLFDLGLLMRGEIIWDKGPSVGISTAWGSFARASNPTLRDVHEYILIFCKESYKLEQTHGKESGIANLEFVEWTKSVWHQPADQIADAGKTMWRFDTLSKKRDRNAPDHPAPFPIDLPMRLMLIYTNIGDIVLDPFMGSGTTALAAKLTHRHFVGYEISPKYCQIAEERLQKFVPGERVVPPPEPKKPRAKKSRRAAGEEISTR